MNKYFITNSRRRIQCVSTREHSLIFFIFALFFIFSAIPLFISLPLRAEDSVIDDTTDTSDTDSLDSDTDPLVQDPLEDLGTDSDTDTSKDNSKNDTTPSKTPDRGVDTVSGTITLEANAAVDFEPLDSLDPSFLDGLTPFHIDYTLRLHTSISSLKTRQTANAVAEFSAAVTGQLSKSGPIACALKIDISDVPVSISLRPQVPPRGSKADAADGPTVYRVAIRFTDPIEEKWISDCPINSDFTLETMGAPEHIFQSLLKACTPPLSSFEITQNANGTLQHDTTCEYSDEDDVIYSITGTGNVALTAQSR